MNAKLLYNCQILTMLDSTIIDCGAVGIVDDRIALVSNDASLIASFESAHSGCEKIDCQGRLVMPGLINTHTHASMTLMRNLYEDMELMTWLNDHVWPFEAKQSEDDIEAGTRLSIAEMLLGGTTTFVDMYFSMARVARATEQMGIRALLTETIIVGGEDRFCDNLTALVSQTQGSPLIMSGVAPHAPYTVPPQTAQLAVETADKHSLPITTHLWESPSEEGIIRDSYGKNPAEYFDQCGILRPSTILAHCVHLNTAAIELLARRGCSVAHCPESNMKLASGVAPLLEMYRAGVNCTIATDGVCSNNDLDMWGEMRSAALLQRVSTMDPLALPPFEILKMATLNGAKAIGMEGELGVIKEGALADIIVVDTRKLHHRPSNNLLSSLIFCAKASDVSLTMVAGEILVRDGKLCHFDIEQLCADVEMRSQRILSEMKQ